MTSRNSRSTGNQTSKEIEAAGDFLHDAFERDDPLIIYVALCNLTETIRRNRRSSRVNKNRPEEYVQNAIQ